MGIQIHLRPGYRAGKLLHAVRRAAFRQLVGEEFGLEIGDGHGLAPLCWAPEGIQSQPELDEKAKVARTSGPRGAVRRNPGTCGTITWARSKLPQLVVIAYVPGIIANRRR